MTEVRRHEGRVGSGGGVGGGGRGSVEREVRREGVAQVVAGAVGLETARRRLVATSTGPADARRHR